MHSRLRAIYLMETSFVEHYRQTFGADQLAEIGFSLEYWNVDHIVYGSHAHSVEESKFLATNGEHFRFKSNAEFLERIKEVDPATTVILSFVSVSRRSFSLYRAIGLLGIPYSCILTGVLPTDIPTLFSGSFSGCERLREIWVYSKKRIFRLIKDIRDFLCKTFLGLTSPRYMLITGLHARYPHTLKGDRTTTYVYSYCYEFDQSLNAEDKGSLISDKYCVFIDQYVPFHPDYALYGSFASKKPDEYYRPLNEFFERIEKEFGMEVIIACHPKSDYESKPDYFDGRRILKGQTNVLCKYADLVLVHDSTAMNYAVIYGKPLVFLTSDYLNEVASCGIKESTLIKRMASWLTDHVIDVNRLDEIMDWSELLKIDDQKRKRFLEQFICCPSASLEPPFCQFARLLKEDYALAQIESPTLSAYPCKGPEASR